MRIKMILFLMLILYNFNVKAQNASIAHKDSIKQLVDLYYTLNLKVFAENSTVKDINALFNIFTDDFLYVHPKYGGEYSRKDIYEGYLNNQNNGGYDGSIINVLIKEMIIGLNGLVVKKAYLKKMDSEEQVEVDLGMTLFEFRNHKISKIVEYW